MVKQNGWEKESKMQMKSGLTLRCALLGRGSKDVYADICAVCISKDVLFHGLQIEN